MFDVRPSLDDRHSPNEITGNPHCLFESFEHAKQALEAGAFDNAEPGPFRIFAVYTLGS
jgi:hypothetical protein